MFFFRTKFLRFLLLVDLICGGVSLGLESPIGEQEPTNLLSVTKLNVNNYSLPQSANSSDDACLTAWNRVIDKLHQGLKRDVMSREFCRFLGFVEAKAGITFPDYAMKYFPVLLDAGSKRIIAFSIDNALDQAGTLPDPRINEREDNFVSEIASDLNLTRIEVVCRTSNATISTEIWNQYARRQVVHLSDKAYALTFLDRDANGLIAVYNDENETPIWTAPVSGFKRRPMVSNGRELAGTHVFCDNGKIVIFTIDRAGFAVSAFSIEGGKEVFSFATKQE